MEIIIPHTNTDLDALGAAVGAQVLYPRAVIVLPGAASPLAAEFISLHRYNLEFRKAKEVDMAAVTRIIVVDTADKARLGPLGSNDALESGVEVHLFDHHPPEHDDLVGTLEVRDQVGATCTLLAELIEESGAPISPLQATAMLLGIYADTVNLTVTSTTDRDAHAAAFLLSRGANLRALARFMQVALSPAQQALLHQLQTHARWLNVNGAHIRLLTAETPEYVGGLAVVVHRLQEIMPAHALFAVVKMADRVYLVGRSEVPWVDVGRVMAAFGGGGHAGAASAVVKGASLDEVTARLEQGLPDLVERPVMAKDVMSSPVKTITAAKPVRDAERLMLRHGHSGLPVVDDEGQLTGIVSLRDVEKARRHGLEHAPVKGIMMREVVTVPPDRPLDEVQDLLVDRDIGRVPVVADGRMVGIITRSDLLGQLYGGPAPRWHRTLFAGPGTVPVEAPGDDLLHRAVLYMAPELLQMLETAGDLAARMGVAVYAVGGFVRDLLLGRPNLDVDLVVEGDGIAFGHALGEALGGRVKEVARFVAAHVYLPETSPHLPTRIDVATARREFYESAAALPIVEHADLREDLYRRDFTINAMAVRLTPHGLGGLVDFFGGLADLRAGQIRILHTLSFVEDPTRILRAVRFAHRYGFQLEAQTARIARSAVDEGFLNRVTIERLRNELILILQEPQSGGALEILQELGVLRRLLPGFQMDEATRTMLDRVDGLAEELPNLYAAALPWLAKLVILLHGLPVAEGLAMVKRLKLKRDYAQAVANTLVEWRIAADLVTSRQAKPSEVVRHLADWPPEGLLMLYLLGGGERVLRYWQEWRLVRLSITGAEVIGAGVPAGPIVGKALEHVLAACLDGQALDRDTQLALALQYAHKGE